LESREYKGLSLGSASRGGEEEGEGEGEGRGSSHGKEGKIWIRERMRGSPGRSDRACQEFEILYNRSSHKGSRDVKDRESERGNGNYQQMNKFLVDRGIGENFEMSKSVPLDGEPMPREEEGPREPSLLFSPQGRDECYVEL
jgi:hypothetical protein